MDRRIRIQTDNPTALPNKAAILRVVLHWRWKSRNPESQNPDSVSTNQIHGFQNFIIKNQDSKSSSCGKILKLNPDPVHRSHHHVRNITTWNTYWYGFWSLISQFNLYRKTFDRSGRIGISIFTSCGEKYWNSREHSEYVENWGGIEEGWGKRGEPIPALYLVKLIVFSCMRPSETLEIIDDGGRLSLLTNNNVQL